MCKWKKGTKQWHIANFNKSKGSDSTEPKIIFCKTQYRFYKSIGEFEKNNGFYQGRAWKILQGIQSNNTGLEFRIASKWDLFLKHFYGFMKCFKCLIYNGEGCNG
ncbi:MAG: hypothetical protein ACRC7W_06455 [Fusobacteriaceae bacterium]